MPLMALYSKVKMPVILKNGKKLVEGKLMNQKKKILNLEILFANI